MAYNSGVSFQQTRDEIGTDGNIDFIPKRFNTSVQTYGGPVITEERDIGVSFVIGHPVNGVLGTTSPQNLLGDQRGASVLISVENANNVFKERFRSSGRIDTSASTGTLDATYPGSYAIPASGTLQSKECFYDVYESKTVQRATISFTINSGTVEAVYLSADGLTYEQATPNTEVDFTVESGAEFDVDFFDVGYFGEDQGSVGSSLFYRIIAESSGTLNISNLNISYRGINI